MKIRHLAGYKRLTLDGKLYTNTLLIKLKTSKKLFPGTKVRIQTIEATWRTLGEINRTDLAWLQNCYFACFKKQFPLPKGDFVEEQEYVLIDD
jgi:hypothetical protein